MTGQDGLPEPVCRALARTPARLLVGRTGPAYPTSVWLRLRADHAAARDAVLKSVNFSSDLGGLAATTGLYEVATLSADREDFIARPVLGRSLSPESREAVASRTAMGSDIQVATGDGLSSMAVTAHLPVLLPLLASASAARGWTWGTPFFIRQCRVGVMNDIGEILKPKILVLLIGERPGLATAESLSAYMAYRPRPGHTDADRNLISNIHSRGVSVEEAAWRIIRLAERMMALELSGVAVKETGLPAAAIGHAKDN